MEGANVHSFYLRACGIEEGTADKSPFAIKMIENILTKLPCFSEYRSCIGMSYRKSSWEEAR